MALPLLAAAPAIAQGASAVANAISQGISNRKNRKFASQMFEREKQRDLEFWNLQNAYNTPEAQMERLRQAGLSPHLVYGNGADAQGGTLKGGSAPSYTNRPVQMDLGSIAETALMFKQANANIARTEAETAAIKSRTVGTDFQNAVNEFVGHQNIGAKLKDVNDYLGRKAQTDMMQLDTLMAMNYTDPDGKLYNTSDPNSPVARAIRAGIHRTSVELENAQRLGDIRAFEAAIKRFEANLAQEGYSPNSPWYVKILGTLLSKYLPAHRENYENNIDPLMGIPPSSKY